MCIQQPTSGNSPAWSTPPPTIFIFQAMTKTCGPPGKILQVKQWVVYCLPWNTTVPHGSIIILQTLYNIFTPHTLILCLTDVKAVHVVTKCLDVNSNATWCTNTVAKSSMHILKSVTVMPLSIFNWNTSNGMVYTIPCKNCAGSKLYSCVGKFRHAATH